MLRYDHKVPPTPSCAGVTSHPHTQIHTNTHKYTQIHTNIHKYTQIYPNRPSSGVAPSCFLNATTNAAICQQFCRWSSVSTLKSATHKAQRNHPRTHTDMHTCTHKHTHTHTHYFSSPYYLATVVGSVQMSFNAIIL